MSNTVHRLFISVEHFYIVKIIYRPQFAYPSVIFCVKVFHRVQLLCGVCVERDGHIIAEPVVRLYLCIKQRLIIDIAVFIAVGRNRKRISAYISALAYSYRIDNFRPAVSRYRKLQRCGLILVFKREVNSLAIIIYTNVADMLSADISALVCVIVQIFGVGREQQILSARIVKAQYTAKQAACISARSVGRYRKRYLAVVALVYLKILAVAGGLELTAAHLPCYNIACCYIKICALCRDKSVYLIDIRIRFPQYYVGIALKRRLIRIDIFVAYAEQREFELLCKLCLFVKQLAFRKYRDFYIHAHFEVYSALQLVVMFLRRSVVFIVPHILRMIVQITVQVGISAYLKRRTDASEIVKTEKRYRYLALDARLNAKIAVSVHIEYVTVVARHYKSVYVYR